MERHNRCSSVVKKMLNLKHLYYFHIFSRELSTTRAAKKLGISVPALSNQLKHLDAFLGAPLTQRVKGQASITELGKIVLTYADRMFSTYDELNLRISTEHGVLGQSFRVGICQYIGAQFSFDLLALIVDCNFSRSSRVKIVYGCAEYLLDEFKKGEFDLILGAFKPDHVLQTSRVAQTFVFPVSLFVPRVLLDGVSTKDRLTPSSSLSEVIDLANRSGLSFVTPIQPSALREETETYMLCSQVVPKRRIECSSASAVVELVERGFAIGFMPTPCLLDFKSAAILKVWGPPAGCWSHSISAVVQKKDGIVMTRASPLSDIFQAH